MSASLLNRGQVRREFAQRMEVSLNKMFVSQLGLITRSNSASERYGWLNSPPAVRERLGPASFKAHAANKIDVANRVWQAGSILDYDDMRRDQSGTVAIRIAELADRMALQPWELISDAIKDGDAATSLAYDGQKFFDTDHLEGDSGTQKNELVAGDVAALDVTTATAPTPEEMVDAILGVIGHMHTILDDSGKPMNENARRFAVMYKPTGGFHGAVVAALTANNLASGKTNTIVASDYEIIPIPNARLDWTTEFAVFRLDGVTRPFIVQEEVPVELRYLDSDEFVATHRAYAVNADWVGNIGYGQWQHAAKATLS